MNRALLSAMLFVSIGMAADQAKKPPASDMQRAIQWERHKEAAAARQARLEARHPSVTYTNNADRSAVPSAPDPGEPQVRKEKEKEKEKDQ